MMNHYFSILFITLKLHVNAIKRGVLMVSYSLSTFLLLCKYLSYQYIDFLFEM